MIHNQWYGAWNGIPPRAVPSCPKPITIGLAVTPPDLGKFLQIVLNRAAVVNSPMRSPSVLS